MPDTDNLYIINSRLKQAMELRDISISELARLCGMPKSSISRYLRGMIIPKPKSIKCMARVLGVSPVWLLGYPADMVEQSSPVKALSGDTIDVSKLTPPNQAKLIGYYQGLLDSQSMEFTNNSRI